MNMILKSKRVKIKRAITIQMFLNLTYKRILSYNTRTLKTEKARRAGRRYEKIALGHNGLFEVRRKGGSTRYAVWQPAHGRMGLLNATVLWRRGVLKATQITQ